MNNHTLPASVKQIIEKLSKKEAFLPAEVVKIVNEAQVQSEDLLPWADFNHSVKDSYGRKLVHKSSNFEIMVMSWVKGDISGIHDHGYATWGAVQIFGENEHAIFRKENNTITTLSRTNFTYGQVVGVGHDLIHQMGNFTENNVLTLHIYGLPEAKENITGDARLYNVALGRTEIINGGVFYDLKEQQIEEVKYGLQADFPTKLRDLTELGNRIKRINPNDNRQQLIKRRLLDNLFLDSMQNYAQIIVDKPQKWKVLNREVQAVSTFLSEKEYNIFYENYKELICEPCLA